MEVDNSVLKELCKSVVKGHRTYLAPIHEYGCTFCYNITGIDETEILHKPYCIVEKAKAILRDLEAKG